MRAIGISELKKCIDDVTVIAMEGVTHMLQWDEPGRTAYEIKKWI
ncbi:hypothetical protein MHH81_05770 [Psychrobacillus sp. FSL H8-0484]